MQPEPTCPRCGGPLRAPGLWSSAWECATHGAVHPFHVLPHPGREPLEHVVALAKVPMWMRWPMPASWVVSGIGYAGDERTGALATLLSMNGAGPLGGSCEMVVVAEEPGVGLGARYAGLPGPDPGEGFDQGAPHAKVETHGHPTALWALDGVDGRAAFVGEAMAQWLWVVVWPAAAGVLLYDGLALVDLRERPVCPDVDFAPLSDRLRPPAA